MPTRDAQRARLEAIFRETIRRLDPTPLTEHAVGPVQGERIRVVAVGKAASAMAAGAVAALGDRIVDGVVVAPSSASLPLDVIVGAHPTPDTRSETAGRLLLERMAQSDVDRVVVLVSGGASSLVAVPAEGITLDEKLRTTDAIYAAGAPIDELNTVRKHLSAIKGGRLAAASAAPVSTFVLSDVVGDDLAVVGSGPTVRDASTIADAQRVVDRYIGVASTPPAVRALLDAGREHLPPRPHDCAILVAGIATLVDTAASVASETGPAEIFARNITDDVEIVAERIGTVARRIAGRDACAIGGGEPTITLPTKRGIGGRAQQLALLVARVISGVDNVTVLVAGSDGIDGNSAAAGAIVDGATWSSIPDPEAAIAQCNAHPALGRAAIVTGATGTNHADLILILGSRSGIPRA